MKIAIIADIHDNRQNLQSALQAIEKLGVEKIICLGDLINPGASRVLADSKIPVFSIWGNNDGDVAKITHISASPDSNLTMSDYTFDIIELDNRKIFLSHFEGFAYSLAKSGDFDAVFYGHSHIKDKKVFGDCLVINPGELSSHKTGVASFAIYDTITNDAEIIDLDNTFSTKWEDVILDEKGRFAGKINY